MQLLGDDDDDDDDGDDDDGDDDDDDGRLTKHTKNHFISPTIGP